MATTISGSSGVTYPAGGTDNVAGAGVGTTDTQTLTNKTLTTPNIDSATITTVSGTAPLAMARAWVQFTVSGTTPTVNASFNVSSITRTGTGIYTVTLTTALSSTSYCVVGSCGPTTAGNGLAATSVFANGSTATAGTTTVFYASFGSSAVGFAEPTYACLAVFR